jgi:hypothetical protein
LRAVFLLRFAAIFASSFFLFRSCVSAKFANRADLFIQSLFTSFNVTGVPQASFYDILFSCWRKLPSHLYHPLDKQKRQPTFLLLIAFCDFHLGGKTYLILTVFI